MTHKHTAGPWHRNIPPASKYSVVFAGRNTHVAQVVSSGLPNSEIEGNTDLIAAAPELLEALKALYNAAPASVPAQKDLWEALQLTRAAIAKAEGV